MRNVDADRINQIGPDYYIAALCLYFDNKEGSAFAEADILDYWSTDLRGKKIPLLDVEKFFKAATDKLFDEGIILRIEDDFGPTMYYRTERFSNFVREKSQDISTPLGKAVRAGRFREWMVPALRNLTDQYYKVVENETAEPLEDAAWEPLPVEVNDPQVILVAEKIDAAIDAVRQDNGYAITRPEERNFVLQSLSVVQETFKKGLTTSANALKTYGLDPLKLVLKRFGEATVGIAAGAARQALSDWIKARIPEFLSSLFS